MDSVAKTTEESENENAEEAHPELEPRMWMLEHACRHQSFAVIQAILNNMVRVEDMDERLKLLVRFTALVGMVNTPAENAVATTLEGAASLFHTIIPPDYPRTVDSDFHRIFTEMRIQTILKYLELEDAESARKAVDELMWAEKTKSKQNDIVAVYKADMKTKKELHRILDLAEQNSSSDEVDEFIHAHDGDAFNEDFNAFMHPIQASTGPTFLDTVRKDIIDGTYCPLFFGMQEPEPELTADAALERYKGTLSATELKEFKKVYLGEDLSQRIDAAQETVSKTLEEFIQSSGSPTKQHARKAPKRVNRNVAVESDEEFSPKKKPKKQPSPKKPKSMPSPVKDMRSKTQKLVSRFEDPLDDTLTTTKQKSPAKSRAVGGARSVRNTRAATPVDWDEDLDSQKPLPSLPDLTPYKKPPTRLTHSPVKGKEQVHVRGRSFWTQQETRAVAKGVRKHGEGLWGVIKADPQFSDILVDRTAVQIKDKWRNLKKLM